MGVCVSTGLRRGADLPPPSPTYLRGVYVEGGLDEDHLVAGVDEGVDGGEEALRDPHRDRHLGVGVEGPTKEGRVVGG